MTAYRVTSRSFLSSSVSYRPHHHDSLPSSTFFTTPRISGLTTASVAFRFLTHSSAKTKTTGEEQSGSRSITWRYSLYIPCVCAFLHVDLCISMSERTDLFQGGRTVSNEVRGDLRGATNQYRLQRRQGTSSHPISGVRKGIDAIVQEYKRTGFAWEQYSGTTGEGRRSRPCVGVCLPGIALDAFCAALRVGPRSLLSVRRCGLALMTIKSSPAAQSWQSAIDRRSSLVQLHRRMQRRARER